MALVVGTPGEGDGRHGDFRVLAQQGPERVEHALAGAQAEGFQAVLEQPVQVRGEVAVGAAVDHGAGVHAGRAVGKLLDDGVVEAQLHAPHRGLGVVVLVVVRGEGVVHGLPHRLPVVELVDAVRLQGLVVDGQLHARGGAEQEGLAVAVGDGFPVVEHFVDAGDAATGAGAAEQTVHQVLRGLPALYVQGEVDGALVGLHALQGGLGEAIHPLLQHVGRARLDRVGADLDLHVRADHIGLNVEVLQQQHKAQVVVLQLVLVAGIPAHAPGMPLVPGKADQTAFLEQGQDLGADHAPVQLAHGIHPAAQQADFRQVGHPGGLRVEEQTRVPALLAGLQIDANLVYGFSHVVKLHEMTRIETALSH